MTTTHAAAEAALDTLTRRGLQLQVRKVSPDGRTITAVVVTYGTTPDDYGTVFAPGVFTASLARSMPVLAWSHEWNRPIGRATRVVEDSHLHTVLEFRLDDPEKVPDAAQAMEQIRSGTLTEVSVGFIPQDAQTIMVDGQEVVQFTTARLDEVSLVLKGAVAGAVILSQREALTHQPAGQDPDPYADDLGCETRAEVRDIMEELTREVAVDGQVDVGTICELLRMQARELSRVHNGNTPLKRARLAASAGQSPEQLEEAAAAMDLARTRGRSAASVAPSDWSADSSLDADTAAAAAVVAGLKVGKS